VSVQEAPHARLRSGRLAQENRRAWSKEGAVGFGQGPRGLLRMPREGNCDMRRLLGWAMLLSIGLSATTDRLPLTLPAGLPKDPCSSQDFHYHVTDEGFSLTCRAPAIDWGQENNPGRFQSCPGWQPQARRAWGWSAPRERPRWYVVEFRDTAPTWTLPAFIDSLFV